MSAIDRIMSRASGIRSEFTEPASYIDAKLIHDPIEQELLMSQIVNIGLGSAIGIGSVLCWIFMFLPDIAVYLNLTKMIPQKNRKQFFEIIVALLSAVILIPMMIVYKLSFLEATKSGESELKEGDFDLYHILELYKNFTNSLYCSEEMSRYINDTFSDYITNNPRTNYFVNIYFAIITIFLLFVKLILSCCFVLKEIEAETVKANNNYSYKIQGVFNASFSFPTKTRNIFFLLAVIVFFALAYVFRKNLLHFFHDDRRLIKDCISGGEVVLTKKVGRFLLMNGYYQVGNNLTYESASVDTNKAYNIQISNIKDKYSKVHDIINIISMITSYVFACMVAVGWLARISPDFKNIVDLIIEQYRILVHILFFVLFVLKCINDALTHEDILSAVTFNSLVALFVTISFFEYINPLHFLFSVTLVVSVTLLYHKHNTKTEEFREMMTDRLKYIEKNTVPLHNIPNQDLGVLYNIKYQPKNLAYGERVLITDMCVDFDPIHKIMKIKKGDKFLVPDIAKTSLEKYILQLFAGGLVEWYDPFNEDVMQNFTKSYDKQEAEEAYDKIKNALTTSLILLTGESGAGKTSFVDMLSLLSPIYKEKIYFQFKKHDKLIDVPLTEVPYKYKHLLIQYEVQSPMKSCFIPSSVADLCKGDEKKLQMAKRLFEEFGVPVDLYQPLYIVSAHLSGGEYNRVACVLNLIEGKKKSLFILDEPTAALDAKNARILINSLIQMQNMTLVISHDMRPFNHTNYINYHLRDGKIYSFYHEASE